MPFDASRHDMAGQVHADQRGERGENGQDVGGELGTGHREEGKDQHRPHQQEAARLKAAAGVACACRRQDPGQQAAQPGQHADKQDRDEVPHRLVAAVGLGQEALEMLVDEKEVRRTPGWRATPR
jgi:hypothetical protein